MNTAATVAYTDLSNKYVGLGIATAVTVVIAGILLQFTRRIRNMPSYFRSNYSCFQGNFKILNRKESFANIRHNNILLIFIMSFNTSFNLDNIVRS